MAAQTLRSVQGKGGTRDQLRYFRVPGATVPAGRGHAPEECLPDVLANSLIYDGTQGQTLR